MGTEEFHGTTPFEGENKDSNKRVGRDTLVTVDLFKRLNGTHWVRVQIRSGKRPEILSRFECDMDKHTNDHDFLREVGIGAGAIAERQNTLYLDHHDPTECVKAAVTAAAELLRGL